MTEPHPQDAHGNYDITRHQARALSLQQGMIFDLGSHALPPLLPFVDIGSLRVKQVWAGISRQMRSVLYGGAESFSSAEFSGKTRATAYKPASEVTGKIVVGKDIGSKPEKYLLLNGPGGSVRFDFIDNAVYQRARRQAGYWMMMNGLRLFKRTGLSYL